jgi:hypothetical protein
LLSHCQGGTKNKFSGAFLKKLKPSENQLIYFSVKHFFLNSFIINTSGEGYVPSHGRCVTNSQKKYNRRSFISRYAIMLCEREENGGKGYSCFHTPGISLKIQKQIVIVLSNDLDRA